MATESSISKNWQPAEKVLKDTRPMLLNMGIREGIIEQRTNPKTRVREVRLTEQGQNLTEILRKQTE